MAFHKFLILAIIIVLTQIFHSRVSGESCITKTFVEPIADTALTNHVINALTTVTSQDLCELRCFLQVKCESYNFGLTDSGDYVCELSDSDATRDELDLIAKRGFIYRAIRNSCLEAQCPEHARCYPDFEHDSHVCACATGYTGNNCETDLDECKIATHTCHVDATCNNTVGSYNCTCNQGFTGDGITCWPETDECASDPCLYGVCIDGYNNYTCICDPESTGLNCDYDLDADVCASSPCFNGVCIEGDDQYTCSCDPGWTGENCDYGVSKSEKLDRMELLETLTIKRKHNLK
ncbi:fibropellin-3-like isoform X2 [Montipora foliosa]|uniref:fibropellin-3-like isoform X2 n=1 Tax=Montipora foliosa TaxID=591990 RepID=UPI0035F14763